MFLKADILKNIFDWLVEYWDCLAVCGVIVYLLINESTRKITFKVLCGIFLFFLAIAVIFLGCVWIFGFDNGFFISWLVLFNLMFSLMIYMSAGELRRTIRLYKHGSRTYGTLIRYSRRAGVVAYSVDGRKYECISSSSLGKYKIGFDKVPVLYDTENHGNSCVDKYDLLPAIAMLIASIILEIGMIAITVYFCLHLFP